MKNIIKSQVVTLASLLAAIVLTVAACGGGGSSGGAGGGSSGSMIRGTVNGGNASIDTSMNGDQWLVAATEFVIRSARADGIPGLTVELFKFDDPINPIDTTTTDAGGNFVFTGVPPETYRIRLSLPDGTILGESGEIVVGVDSETTVQIAGDGTLLNVEIEVEGDTISGEVEDDDSVSVDDCDSDDDSDSVDSDSDDDSDSVDSDSVDDDSSACGGAIASQ